MQYGKAEPVRRITDTRWPAERVPAEAGMPRCSGKTARVVDPDELDRRIEAELVSQRAEREATPLADTTMFLSHHWPSRYDRCVVIGGRHVCRRCAVLYPVALLTAFAVGTGLTWPERFDPWVFWLLPLPGVIEFVLDVMGAVRHRPIRQIVVSALLAVAYGKMLWRYWHHPGDGLVWAVVLVNTGICLAAALLAVTLRRNWVDVGDGG